MNSRVGDLETDLYCYNARWNDPTLGRFITEDPIKDGTNWYIYCSNNPLNFIDPTGLVAIVGDDTKGNVITENDYNPVSVDIDISRDHDGYSTKFDAERTVTVNMENGQQMLTGYDNEIAANADSAKFARDNEGMTKPDGEYYFTNTGGGLPKDLNDNGTANSGSFDNVYRYQTNDKSIHPDDRNAINTGMYLNHVNSYRSGVTWNNKSNTAGCTSQKGSFSGQNTFINQLAGVDPRNIITTIQSETNEKIDRRIVR